MELMTIANLILSTTGLLPWLKEKLGGTVGESAAQKILDVAKAVTGGESTKDIVDRLAASEALSAELRSKLLGYEQDILRLEAADRADARAMQVAALGQSDVFSKRFVYYFITAWSLFTMVYISLISFATIPPANIRFADTILGFVLGTVIASMFAYLLGSTWSGKTKDASISALAAAVKR